MKTIEKNYYVYIHTNSQNGEIFYVGLGKGNRAYSKSGRNKFWKNYTQKHDYNIEIVYSNLTRYKASDIERELISKLGRRCKDEGTLTNICDGGEGSIGYTHSPEWKINHGKIMKGKKLGPLSKEAKEKISKSQSGKSKKNNKIIRQYDLEGNLIKIYNSSTQAKKETNIKGISENATGYKNNMLKSAGGYVWIYEKHFTPKKLKDKLKIANSPKHHPQHATDKRVSKMLKPIIQYTLNGDFVKEWGSIKEASIYYNIHSSNIGNCCRGTQNSSRGYIWKFKN
jgi:hypothetical protein